MKTVALICRFYLLRFYVMQPFPAALSVIATVAASVSATSWVVMDDLHRNAAAQIVAFSTANTRPAAVAVIAAVSDAGRELPNFSSARLAADFHAVASDVKLPIDEVSYNLDAAANQPFLRYRITLSVKTGYPEIRKFVAALIAQLPNIALDSVRCGKEDLASTALSCELGFSAFYRKGEHG